MKKTASGIYAIVNLVNKKSYVGRSVNINRRWWEHRNELKYNKHYNSYLQNAWNKYGEENFELLLLEECNKALHAEKEFMWINEMQSFDRSFGYNLREEDENGKMREKHKEHLSEKTKQQHQKMKDKDFERSNHYNDR